LVGIDLVKEVSCKKTYLWNKNGKRKVVVLDCGAKHNIMRELEKRECQVTVVPANTTAKEILALNPNGLMLSNGPGDPAAVTYVIETVRSLIGKLPIFGICLGHQMIGLALGGKTFKLKFGHRGANQPVMNLKTRKVEITSQNHGFCVDVDSLNKTEVELTHINLNDKTAEGLRHKKHPVFCVQYHPEASPGPHDSKYLFDEFIKIMEK
jgi:carbamoyl-phosphate synthase small subunit